MGGVSRKAVATGCGLHFRPQQPLRPLHGRPGHSGLLGLLQIYTSSPPLSRPHLANDEAHALYHGYACSESTSASLRPKRPGSSDIFSLSPSEPHTPSPIEMVIIDVDKESTVLAIAIDFSSLSDALCLLA